MGTTRKMNMLSSIAGLLKGGMSCSKVTICLALGVVLGIFPVIGTTTLLCTLAAFVFRLNLPIIQLVNYAVYPLQLVLLAFFYGAGSRLFTGKSSLYAGSEMIELLRTDLWGSLTAFWDLTLYAVSIWLFISPLLLFVLYGVLNPVVRKLSSGQHSPLTGR